MNDRRTQAGINQSEWENPDNWSSIYFSKKDTRAYVPKRNPKHGWTLNFGSPSGARWIYYLLGIFLMLGCILGGVFAFIIMELM